MEQAGSVECTSDLGEGAEPSRRVYAITPQGRDALHEWFASGVAPEHQRDEISVKLMVGLVCGEADPARLIQTQRAHLYQKLHAATNQRDSNNPKAEIVQILLLDKSIMHLEADLRWLDITEQRLEVVKRQPFPEPEIRPRCRPRKI